MTEGPGGTVGGGGRHGPMPSWKPHPTLSRGPRGEREQWSLWQAASTPGQVF